MIVPTMSNVLVAARPKHGGRYTSKEVAQEVAATIIERGGTLTTPVTARARGVYFNAYDVETLSTITRTLRARQLFVDLEVLR